MERWIQMHYQIKEREQALEIAKNRELFYWLGGFYLTAVFGSISLYQRSRRPITFLPMVPLTFVMGYYADLAYGSKIHRIKGKRQWAFKVLTQNYSLKVTQIKYRIYIAYIIQYTKCFLILTKFLPNNASWTTLD